MTPTQRNGLQGPGNLARGLSGLLGLLAVALGALGAHALKGQMVQEQQALFQTAWNYHMSHALALGLLGASRRDEAQGFTYRLMLWCWFSGIVVFSGTLYALALGAPRALAHLTPVGGLLLMAGWTCLLVTALKSSPKPKV